MNETKIVTGDVACYPGKFWLHIFSSHFLIAKFCMPGLWLVPFLIGIGVLIGYFIFQIIFSRNLTESTSPFFIKNKRYIILDENLKIKEIIEIDDKNKK